MDFIMDEAPVPTLSCDKHLSDGFCPKWMGLIIVQPMKDVVFFLQWSFGVLMWEVITRGITPYSYIDPKEQLYHLRQGGRLGKPHDCPIAL